MFLFEAYRRTIDLYKGRPANNDDKHLNQILIKIRQLQHQINDDHLRISHGLTAVIEQRSLCTSILPSELSGRINTLQNALAHYPVIHYEDNKLSLLLEEYNGLCTYHESVMELAEMTFASMHATNQSGQTTHLISFKQ